MRLSQLRDTKVKTLDGESLGRVHEVHTDGGRVVALVCGSRGFIESLTAKSEGRRIPWECVRKITPKAIIVTPDPPRRGPARKSGASRSQQGTRRPSGRQSRR